MSRVTGDACDFAPSWEDEEEDELVYELPLERQIQSASSLNGMSSTHQAEQLSEDNTSTATLDGSSSTEGFQYRPPPELRWSNLERGYRTSTLRSRDYNRFAAIPPPSNNSSEIRERLTREFAPHMLTSESAQSGAARARAYTRSTFRQNYESTIPPNIALSNRLAGESALRPLDISMRETRLLLGLNGDNDDNATETTATAVFPPVAWGNTSLTDIVDPDGKKCSICFNEPPDDVSALDCCTHTYCFECLKKWSNTRPVCPLCKRNFKRIYHEVKSNEEYETYEVPTLSPHLENLYSNSEFRNLMYPLLHRRYIYWVTRFEHTRSRSRYIQAALPQVAGDENRSAAVLTGVSVDVLRMRRILYDRNVFTDRVNGVVRDEVGGSFFANATVEVHRIFPYIRRELIFLFGFSHQNLIGPLTRAIIPLLALPGLRTESITQQLRPILGRYTDRFLFEIVQFARTDCSLDQFESGYIYPTYLDNDWDSRIYREPIIPLPAEALESRIIRTALGQPRVKILTQVPPPLESTGEAVLNSEFVRNSQRLVSLEPIASRPRFNYAATTGRPPRIPRVLIPPARRPSSLQPLRRSLAKTSGRTTLPHPYRSNSYGFSLGSTPRSSLTTLTSSSGGGSVTSVTSAGNVSAAARRTTRGSPRAYSYSDNDECEIVDQYDLSPPPPPQRSQQEPIDLTCPSSSSSSTEYTPQDDAGSATGGGAYFNMRDDTRPSTSKVIDPHQIREMVQARIEEKDQQRRDEFWVHRPATQELNLSEIGGVRILRKPDMVIDLTVPDSPAVATTVADSTDQATNHQLHVKDSKPDNSPPLVGESASGYTLHYSGVSTSHPTDEPTDIDHQLPYNETLSPPSSLRKRKAGGECTSVTRGGGVDDEDEPSTKRKMPRPMKPTENALSQAFYDNLRRDEENFSDDDDDDDDDVIFNGYLRGPNTTTTSVPEQNNEEEEAANQ